MRGINGRGESLSLSCSRLSLRAQNNGEENGECEELKMDNVRNLLFQPNNAHPKRVENSIYILEVVPTS